VSGRVEHIGDEIEIERVGNQNLAVIICEICQSRFHVRKYRALTARFCSQQCGGHWHAKARLSKLPRDHMRGNKFRVGLAPANAFLSGHKAWNRDLRGIHLSPESEFKKGRQSEKKMPVGSATIRTRSKDGKPRAFIKVGDPNDWTERAILVWEAANGTLGIGFVVHHKDRNTLNDTLDNLEALSRAKHLEEHRSEFKYTRTAGDAA
jgi:hypothetical protein